LVKVFYDDKSMANFLNKNFPFRTEKDIKTKANILLCKECNAAYWFKSWHHSLDDFPKLKEEKNLKMVVCPSCKMKEDGKYEGELILENIPQEKSEEIKNLVVGFGDISFKNDPMARTLTIDEIARGMIKLTVTQSQMINQLAKKIKKAYKGKVNFINSKRDDVVRIRVVFP
jgi:hypothetical protein